MVRDLLLGFVREPWVSELDFGTLERYPTEFIDERLRQRRSDVIWRLHRGPEWLYLYILLEFQSGVHPFMAARLSTYLDLLYQDLICARQLGRGRRLPLVLPVVLYNGHRRWTAPTDLTELIEPGPAALEAYRPRLRYLLIDENAYRDTELAAMRNLVAALFRLEHSPGPESVQEVLTSLAAWLADPEQAELRHSFVLGLREAFLRTRLPGVALPELQDLEEVQIMLTERVLDWTRQWKQEGLEEGRKEGLREGRKEGEAMILRRQLIRRFGALPARAEERLAQASTEELEIWADRVLEATSLSEVFDAPRDA